NTNLQAGQETSLDLTNPAIPTGIVTTQAVWDGNSRPIARIDANGNVTSTHYDNLDRPDVQTFADQSARVTKYDPDDDAVQTTDPNGTVIRSAYDGISRPITVQVVNKAQNLAGTGQGVVGSSLQAFEYDGLSRIRQAIDDNGDSTTLGVATSFT